MDVSYIVSIVIESFYYGLQFILICFTIFKEKKPVALRT